MLDIINKEPTIQLSCEGTTDVKSIESDIVFSNVSFKYSEAETLALDNISLVFKAGKTTALIGESGSGKSTIVKLLERFYDPQSGSVIVNGHDLRDLNLRQYRLKIGYVGQEPCLLNETIRLNLLNSNPAATDDDMWKALKMANADGFVSKLPDKIDTQVGELGNKLSGGQKQRLAIARALVRNPDVLIFDEATSALDHANERKVQMAIDNIDSSQITRIVIAHRLTTVKAADHIIVMSNGQVVEEGTYQDLLNLNGILSEYSNQQNNLELHINNTKISRGKQVNN